LNSSCAKYLDIVPDNTVTLEDYFSRKEMAWNTLSKVYSYLPEDHTTHKSSWLLGDEWIGKIGSMQTKADNVAGNRIMRGLQNINEPILGLWNGTGQGKPLYQGIRSADIFLQYIDLVEDMLDSEKAEWKAQVKFLKAYFHFLLIRQYGPIVLVNEPVAIDATNDELFLRRSKVEDCFNYVLRLIDEAIPDLKIQTDESNLGQVNKMIALSIKARILLYRASPFYNGNRSYYEDFLDHNGEPFFPLEYNHEKWKDALDAVEEAIQFGEANGYGLYEYEGYPYAYDREDILLNPAIDTLYDLRMLIVEPWNKELIWGLTAGQSRNDLIAHHSNIWLPSSYTSGLYKQFTFTEQWLCASYAMLERYYTRNGIPISDDMTFDKNNMFNVVTIPGISEPEYQPLRGFFMPGMETIRMYMNREMRFYANIGIPGGYWRAHAERIPTQFYAGTNAGYEEMENHFCTGIGVKKFAHPETKSGNWVRTTRYPYPIIRMADLYLMKAEILNEYQDQPDEKVYEAINKVRRRAGIPDVEDAWSNALVVTPRSLDKHTEKDGMRDIILHERGIELAFEGSRFWDMYRHKRAVSEFSTPIMGWSQMGISGTTFFVLTPKESRRFLEKDYLWPLSLTETNINGNLIQNPGW
jgi:hypothetical protein